MTLHVFNPEHEIALAFDCENITLPHAIQEFKMNLGFIPSFWANDGDYVLVEDSEFAAKSAKSVKSITADVHFIEKDELSNYTFTKVKPWGWDKCLCSYLYNAKCNGPIPNKATINIIRELSSRKQTVKLLPFLRRGLESYTVGQSFYIDSFDDVIKLISQFGEVVIKTLWSSSGRGIRYVSNHTLDKSVSGWIRNAISLQGGVTLECYYNKVKDFAMEFYSYGNGIVDYQGLSIFDTVKGHYSGNIIADEDSKLRFLLKYLSCELLTEIKTRIISYFAPLLNKVYEGPFGVDMMIVSDPSQGFYLNPCIEINMRRTMGHVANSIIHFDTDPDKIMRIVHNVNYRMKFEPIENCFVKVF